MKVANYSEFRKNLKKYMDDVTQNHDSLIVHRQGGETVIVISLQEYNSLTETEYLDSSPVNRNRLQMAKKSLENNNGKKRALVE